MAAKKETKKIEKNNETINQFNKYVMHSYGRYDVVMDKGGHEVATDDSGKKYIDFGSGSALLRSRENTALTSMARDVTIS